jgi:hypothetical protein
MLRFMYLEIQSRKSKSGEERWAIKVCENVRVDGKPRKKHVRNVGVAYDLQELEQLKRFGAKIIDAEIARQNGSDSLFETAESLENSAVPGAVAISDYRNLKENSRQCEGVREVFGHLFDESGFEDLLSGSAGEVLKETVLARIEEPSSKRKTQINLVRDCGFSTSLDSIYRMMDKLEGKGERLSKIIISDAKKLFDERIDLLFFDVTTLYFESIEEDELRSFGYSKDQKYHTTQVVLLTSAILASQNKKSSV